jgi:hypothetical protein
MGNMYAPQTSMKRMGQDDHEIMLLHNSPINIGTASDYHALDDRLGRGHTTGK